MLYSREAGEQAGIKLDGLSILIVHDDPKTAGRLAQLMGKYGGSPVIATSIEAATQAITPIDACEVGLAIIDDDLPGTIAGHQRILDLEKVLKDQRRQIRAGGDETEIRAQRTKVLTEIRSLIDPNGGFVLAQRWINSYGIRFPLVMMATPADHEDKLSPLVKSPHPVSSFYKPTTNEEILSACVRVLS